MIKHKKVVHLTRVGYEYTQSDSMAGYTITTYYLNGQMHNIEGVAMHYEYKHAPNRPDEGYYYIMDRQIFGKDLILLKELIKAPLKELPKYINDPLFACVVKERLKNA